jgi:hypothetical protein
MQHLFLRMLMGLAGLTAAFGVEPPQPVLPVPSPQQLAWQRMEMTLLFVTTSWTFMHENSSLFAYDCNSLILG